MLFLCAAIASPAVAATKIGRASSIEKDVRGDTGAGARKLAVGEPVHADEVLTTASASRGKFVFDDRADLAMGPSSRVKLDSFVYSGGSKGVVFNAAKGAFRFVSSPKGGHDYDVRTPTATIGVRGTRFAVRVLGGRTDAVLYGGVIEVCSIASGQCRTLDLVLHLRHRHAFWRHHAQAGRQDRLELRFDLPRPRPPQRQRAAGQCAAGRPRRAGRR
ncbi:FecR family protein [Methylosinus trichosporium]|uniref:FecR family protein n=1 Tax=Methylosinus trichosporium TaxID=426 RepID=UPI0024BA4E1C|nr:FecR domain-containing protein [Methylosinus trichosporium]